MPNGYVSRRSSLRVNGRLRRSSTERIAAGATFGEPLAVERDALLHAGDQSPEPLCLQLTELLAWERLELRLEDHESGQ